MPERWRKLLRFVPAAVWYAVIFGFSAQTGQSSGALSDGMAHGLLERFWPAFFLRAEEEGAALFELLTVCLRKSAHMAVYFVLAGLLLWALRDAAGPGRRGAWTALLCAVLAGLDEFHQTFVPGRSGQVRDVLIDLAGAGCLLLLWALWRRLTRRRGKSGETG